MRPRGTHGEIARAMLEAARQQPGGTVVQIAQAAQVSVQVARYTASRLIERGHLVVVDDARPAKLAPADSAESSHTLLQLPRSFWDCVPQS